MTTITRKQCQVELFKFYAEEGSIARPELGKILGKTVGEMAAFHRDSDKAAKREKDKIGPWPRLNEKRKANRKCQYPVGLPGFVDFHICGRTRTTDPLVCDLHEGQVWAIPECEEITD